MLLDAPGHRFLPAFRRLSIRTLDGDEPLDLSEPEDWGEASPFESRQAPRTKADLLNEIRQRADRRTGQQEAEQRQIDPWQAQPPQRRGHGR